MPPLAGAHLRRRLLFAAPTIPSSCPDFCDPDCALYTHCILTVPSSPFAPSSIDHDPSISTPIVLHPRSHGPSLFPALPIVAGAVLAAALVLLVAFYLHILIRRRRRSTRTAAALAFANGDAAVPGNAGNDFFDGMEVDHHVWYIRTVGLDESTIGAITAWAYKADDGALDAATADCSVCLAEFRDGEVLRRLPKCGHAFHLECIDTWLRSHVNCPLCRAPVVTAAAGGGDGGGARHDGDSGPSSFGSSSSSSLSGGSDPLNTNSISLVPIHNSLRINWPSESTREVSQTVVLEARLEIEPQIGI